MRTPTPREPRGLVRFLAFAVITIFALAACGEATPSSVPPTAHPTPSPTPDPHLADPATADEVWRGLGAAGLRMTPNNATTGGSAGLVKRINATYLGWPLKLSEYETSKALAEDTIWEPGEKPGQGEAPIAIAGGNILVTWGPQTGAKPKKPGKNQAEGLDALVTALDRLLSPLRARTVVVLEVPGVVLGPIDDPSAPPDETTADAEATKAP